MAASSQVKRSGRVCGNSLLPTAGTGTEELAPITGRDSGNLPLSTDSVETKQAAALTGGVGTNVVSAVERQAAKSAAEFAQELDEAREAYVSGTD
jgi:hypothetical protein